MHQIWINASVGGALIGLASILLLVVNGKIAGISGIFRGAMLESQEDAGRWRLTFVLGLIAAGLGIRAFGAWPQGLQSSVTTTVLILAGVLVGFGTQLGSGCTSGHGVCGIGRLSPRSFVAVSTFIGAGMGTVYLGRHIFSWIG